MKIKIFCLVIFLILFSSFSYAQLSDDQNSPYNQLNPLNQNSILYYDYYYKNKKSESDQNKRKSENRQERIYFAIGFYLIIIILLSLPLHLTKNAVKFRNK